MFEGLQPRPVRQSFHILAGSSKIKAKADFNTTNLNSKPVKSIARAFEKILERQLRFDNYIKSVLISN